MKRFWRDLVAIPILLAVAGLLFLFLSDDTTKYDKEKGPVSVNGCRLGSTRKQLEAIVGPSSKMYTPECESFGPVVASYSPDGSVRTLYGTQLTQGRIHLVKTGDSQEKLRAVMGQPDSRGADGPTQVWGYQLEECEASFSIDNVSGNVLSLEIRGRRAE